MRITRKPRCKADCCSPDHESEMTDWNAVVFILFHLLFTENVLSKTEHMELGFEIFISIGSRSTDSPSVNISKMHVLHLFDISEDLWTKGSTYSWAVWKNTVDFY